MSFLDSFNSFCVIEFSFTSMRARGGGADQRVGGGGGGGGRAAVS